MVGVESEGESPSRYNCKGSDGAFEQLIAEGVAKPAPYAARFKWVQLTRKARAELGLA